MIVINLKEAEKELQRKGIAHAGAVTTTPKFGMGPRTPIGAEKNHGR